MGAAKLNAITKAWTLPEGREKYAQGTKDVSKVFGAQAAPAAKKPPLGVMADIDSAVETSQSKNVLEAEKDPVKAKRLQIMNERIRQTNRKLAGQ